MPPAQLMPGAVLSMLTVTTLLGSLTLPALSDTVCAVDETPVPSSLSVSSPGQSPVAMPDRLSAQVKYTVTSSSYQPLPFGDRVAAAEMVGWVLSMLTVTTLLGSLTLPALSDTGCAVDETAAPSALST